MTRGTSAIRLTAALKNASAGWEKAEGFSFADNFLSIRTYMLRQIPQTQIRLIKVCIQQTVVLGWLVVLGLTAL